VTWEVERHVSTAELKQVGTPRSSNIATSWYSVQVAQDLTVHPELPGQSPDDFLSLDQAVNRLALMDTEHQVAVSTLTILMASRSEPPG